MAFPRVLVIYNEPVLPSNHPEAAAELDVIESTEIVVSILQAAGFPVRQLGFSFDPRPLLNELRDQQTEVVFNLFEGIASHSATEISVAAFLEWLNVPFTGSPSFAIALGRDKIRTQTLLRGAGLNVAKSQVIEQFPITPWPHAWPAIVKPACQDCSVGIEQGSVVSNQQSMESRVGLMLERYGPPVLVEEFIPGRELHVNIIEEPCDPGQPPALVCVPLSEIQFAQNRDNKNYWPIYTYEAKWNTASDEFVSSAIAMVDDLPSEWRHRINRDAVNAFKLLGLRDCGRIDLRVTSDGQPFILEVNPNPYLHGEGMIDGLNLIGRTHAKFIENLVWSGAGAKKVTSNM